MAGNLLPPPELAPPLVEGQDAQLCIRLWADLLDCCDAFFVAGFRGEHRSDSSAGISGMASETLLKTFKHVWLTLEPLHLPTAVMGGLALAAWGHVRSTRDVDILLGVESAKFESLAAQLATAGLRPKHQPPVLPLGTLEIFQLLYEPPGAYVDLQVNLLLAHSDNHQQALSRRLPLHLDAVDLDTFILSCEDMILHKLLAGRIIDRADAAALLRANRPRLDLNYLFAWSGKLGLTGELKTVWPEALPGEQFPGGALS
jgi:hypothetical protein